MRPVCTDSCWNEATSAPVIELLVAGRSLSPEVLLIDFKSDSVT